MFYKILSKYYDIVFPLSEMKLDFIEENINKNSQILDLACGSGNYALALSERGHNVTAVDLDNNMIENLREKGKNNNQHIEAVTMNMKDIKKLNKKFDCIICIGNSLVHLDNEEEINDFLKECFECLNSGGKLVIQIVNYDRIIKYNIDELPTINREKQGVIFERKYRKEEGKIVFKGILNIINEEKDTYENEVRLYPLKSENMVHRLKSSGFSNIELYGDYKKSKYSDQSFFTIAVVSK